MFGTIVHETPTVFNLLPSDQNCHTQHGNETSYVQEQPGTTLAKA